MPEEKPSKLRPRRLDDKDSREAAKATYAARMGVQRSTEPADPTPAWLRRLLDAAEKPAKRNPQLADALNGVPVKYRPAPAGPDPKDTHGTDPDEGGRAARPRRSRPVRPRD